MQLPAVLVLLQATGKANPERREDGTVSITNPAIKAALASLSTEVRTSTVAPFERLVEYQLKKGDVSLCHCTKAWSEEEVLKELVVAAMCHADDYGLGGAGV